MEAIKPNPRRNFLLFAGLCAVGAAAVAATTRAPPEEVAAVQAPPAEKWGYHVTPHILTYYKTSAL